MTFSTGYLTEFQGFYDVTGNFELNFRAIGWLYLGAAFDFSSFFEPFLMTFSMEIGQAPYWSSNLTSL